MASEAHAVIRAVEASCLVSLESLLGRTLGLGRAGNLLGMSLLGSRLLLSRLLVSLLFLSLLLVSLLVVSFARNILRSNLLRVVATFQGIIILSFTSIILSFTSIILLGSRC